MATIHHNGEDMNGEKQVAFAQTEDNNNKKQQHKTTTTIC